MSVDTLFVGLGSDHGDDSVGWLVADELTARGAAGMDVRYAKGPLDLLDWLEGIRCLAVCDACRGAGPAGSWHRWTWPQPGIPFVRPSGTHSLGLADALHLASRLAILPKQVLLWGIEVAGVHPGDGPTDGVSASVAPVVSDILSVLVRHPAVRSFAERS
ncbi:MAG TPA: hydrogenase maturation protease [Planctomycetaceae bacterium]|jgi:hydrogenase maturation protease|nr:hydrogenase maturation protease [Planctomycetaceae bacterium]